MRWRSRRCSTRGPTRTCVDEALARIPIHNPDWTNFNESDPGVTLLELFAFLTESLLYRANQIPERNRRAFLSLLGVPLKPATAAQGIVTLSNDSGPLQTTTLGAISRCSPARSRSAPSSASICCRC